MGDTIYEEIEVVPAINAAGTKTTFGGPMMPPEVADAMREAAETSAHISELQARAATLIRDATGAEDGHVTSGASAGLTLAAAACIAGDDLGKMKRLPHAETPAEIVMPRVMRNGYDHAFEVAGAELIDVGDCSRMLGETPVNVTPWELKDAISEATAAIAYLPRPGVQLTLETVVDVGEANDVPVIVDGAASLPPKENLSSFIDKGADLVAFSGGKAIRGPQGTGILAGREDLVRSAKLQHLDMGEVAELWDPPAELVDTAAVAGVPRHGLGRGFKVAKEDLVGLITALTRFLETDDEQRRREWYGRSERIADALCDAEGLDVRIEEGSSNAPGDVTLRSEILPSTVVTVDADRTGVSAYELVGRLRTEENPRILVKGQHAVDGSSFAISPLSITDEQADYVGARIHANLER
jgi:L-seryl-tRNA(Ser) seleniumtransferase